MIYDINTTNDIIRAVSMAIRDGSEEPLREAQKALEGMIIDADERDALEELIKTAWQKVL